MILAVLSGTRHLLFRGSRTG